MSGEERPDTGHKHYEMLWDCAYCATPKLLGKSHRHCPKCGAPQDPERRYFPADSEKVAVEDHVYQGADRVCEACDTANAAAAIFCVNCGAPTGGARDVSRVGSPAPERPRGLAAVSAAAPRRRRRGCLALAGGAGAAIAGLIVSFCWTRAETFRVTGHAWEHRIAVERLQTVSESGWREAVPRDAREVSCSRRERETRQIPDGETCETVNVDDGDGTFHQEQRCQTSYRSESVYDEHCDWRADRWKAEADRVARGDDRSPRWPETGFPSCQQLGCQREAGRSTRYLLRLTGEEGQQESCPVPEPRWRVVDAGTRLQLRVRVVTGGLDCGSLQAE
jgi:hypothetical protein